MTIGEAVAGPAHAHLHRKVHEKKDVDWAALDWNNMGIDWASAYKAGQASKTADAAGVAAPSAAAPSAAAPSPAPPTDGPATNNVVPTTVDPGAKSLLFKGLVGASNLRTSFGDSPSPSGAEGDFYVGNYGVPYGSNMIKVDSTSGYDFTATFVNTQSVPITVNCWNKVGPDMQPLSGSALAPQNTALTFSLLAGSKQVVAFAEDSQVGCAQACSETAASGAYATTWFEANFLSKGTGYDISAIMNPAGNNYNMAITSVEAPGCTSDMTQNYWLTATQPIGGSDGSCFIAQSTATLTVTMGGTV